MKTLRQALRKWLGIEALQAQMDSVTPQDYGLHGFNEINYAGHPVERVSGVELNGEQIPFDEVEGRIEFSTMGSPLNEFKIVKGYESERTPTE